MVNIQEISTDKLSVLLGKNKIIDIRPVDAYNGWRLVNEKRGGHIIGAKSLDFKWTNYMDWIEIVRSKKIFPEDDLVIYSYKKDESVQVAKMFLKAGYKKIFIYNEFVSEWSKNSDLPMDLLPRYEFLVHPQWLYRKINNSGNHSNTVNTIICHAHYRNRDAYLSGHIPGAIDIDTLALESSDTWNRRSPDELKKAFEKHGITADSQVVLYGKFMYPDNDSEFPGSAAGQLAAIRCAFIMMYAGVKDVRVLNGGFQSWKDAGYPVSTVDVTKQAVAEFGAVIPRNSDLAVDIPKAKEMLKASDADLVCVRSWPEYIGEVSGYNYIKKKGRISGAVFGNCGSDAYHMENYRNPDHTCRESQEIAKLWKDAGLNPKKHLAFYCGTGWRGSEAFYNAWLMGWPHVSVFDGGWFEWSNDSKNSFETGLPE